MQEEAFGSQAEVVPKKKGVKAALFVVVHDTEDGLKFAELTTRGDARKFINQIGADKFVTAYRVNEVIKLKTTVSI